MWTEERAILCILASVAGADALVEEGGWSRNTMAGLACGGGWYSAYFV